MEEGWERGGGRRRRDGEDPGRSALRTTPGVSPRCPHPSPPPAPGRCPRGCPLSPSLALAGGLILGVTIGVLGVLGEWGVSYGGVL